MSTDTDIGTEDTLIHVELPSRMSTLLIRALGDLERCERDPRYRVDMNYFHHPSRGLCSVCLAGATLTSILPPTATINMYYQHYQHSGWVDWVDGDTAEKLSVLDYLRLGLVEIAADIMNVRLPPGCPRHVDVANYDVSPENFRNDIRGLATTLRRHGL